MKDDYKITVQELKIIQELLKQCTNENISQGLMYRLNEKWEHPNFNIDYKEHEIILTPFEEVKEFYLKNDLQFNLTIDSRAYCFISEIIEIYSIRIWSEDIHISAKSRLGNTIIAIDKNGEVVCVGFNFV